MSSGAPAALTALRSAAEALRTNAALNNTEVRLGLDLCDEITGLLNARAPPSCAAAAAPPLEVGATVWAGGLGCRGG
eukprot:4545505-Prymnesium_polylepis.1